MEQAVNLGIKEQTTMLRIALFMLTIALALSITLVETEVSLWYRMALFVPFSLASMNLYQGLFKT